jgi:hypothetical protein
MVRAISFLLMTALGCMGAEPMEFNRDIRPILSDRCLACHGQDAAAKGLRLRLDVEDSAKADLGRGRRAIVAGDAAASDMIRRIRTENKALHMPPSHTGLSVSAAELAKLEQWINEGAKWERHWAFLVPRKRAVPAGVGAIDYFVRERLRAAGLTAAPEADRYTLIRRASLDLTGLPPTPAEADAFASDLSPDAYEKLIDRLLASPRFAERLAMRWMDASRYADTNGYQTDADRIMWRWKDWVIGAIHANMPFDRFLTEQLAGDLLPSATVAQHIATGFNRNHRGNSEGGIVPEEYLAEYAADRMETMATVFLGLTIGCSRCHNHKYDPFTQKEYYQLFAYFDQIGEPGRYLKYGNSPPMVSAPTPEQAEKLEAFRTAAAAAKGRVAAMEPAIAAGQRAWERTLSGGTKWALEEDLESKLEMGKRRFDGEAAWAGGEKGKFGFLDRFTLSVWVKPESEDGVILHRMQDSENYPEGYGLNLEKGKLQIHFAVRRLDDAILVESAPLFRPGQWRHIALSYDGSRYAEGVKLYVDGVEQELNILLDALNQDFGRAGDIQFGAGGGWTAAFRGEMDGFRAYKRDLGADEVATLALTEPLAAIAAIPEASRTAVQKTFLRHAFLRLGASEEMKQARVAMRTAADALALYEREVPTVMTMAEPAKREATRVLLRGSYDRPGEAVERGVPGALHAMPANAPRNRLGLAQWLTSKENPLTARVTVNRFWQMIFGTGLVKTTEDFGAQGEWPSHPELLDWLAVDFVESGWDVKRLFKTIAMSATYRQSAAATPAHLEKDPENRLLSRGGRLRLPAETVRDQALAVSGLLVERVGGPPVKPYQPKGLWSEIGGRDYERDSGEGLYRRSLYTFWKRTAPPPFMATFDAALRESCVVRESRTNTPLQALHLMNDVQFLEAARVLAQRVLREGPPDRDGRLRHLFRLAAVRRPREKEMEAMRGMLAAATDRYRTDAKAAQAVLAQGDAPRDTAIEEATHAAWMVTASLVLNLDAVVTRE